MLMPRATTARPGVRAPGGRGRGRAGVGGSEPRRRADDVARGGGVRRGRGDGLVPVRAARRRERGRGRARAGRRHRPPPRRALRPRRRRQGSARGGRVPAQPRRRRRHAPPRRRRGRVRGGVRGAPGRRRGVGVGIVGVERRLYPPTRRARRRRRRARRRRGDPSAHGGEGGTRASSRCSSARVRTQAPCRTRGSSPRTSPRRNPPSTRCSSAREDRRPTWEADERRTRSWRGRGVGKDAELARRGAFANGVRIDQFIRLSLVPSIRRIVSLRVQRERSQKTISYTGTSFARPIDQSLRFPPRRRPAPQPPPLTRLR